MEFSQSMKFTPGPVPRLFLPRPRRASLKLQAAGGPSSPRLCPHPLGAAAGLRETSKHLEESRELRRTAKGRRFASVRRPGREAALRPPLLGHGREREGDGVGGGGTAWLRDQNAAQPGRDVASPPPGSPGSQPWTSRGLGRAGGALRRTPGWGEPGREEGGGSGGGRRRRGGVAPGAARCRLRGAAP